MKKRAFISFIHEEEKVAYYLKEWMEKIFLGQVDIFVSSSDLKLGHWLEQVRDRLKNASFVFPLLSPISQTRAWIYFESGCAYVGEETLLIPLCHRGLLFNDLEAPFNQIQSFNLTVQNDVQKLVKNLAEKLDLRVPDVDYERFCSDIASLDRGLCSFISSFDQLIEKVTDCKTFYDIEIDNFQIWDELDLRGLLHNKKIIELKGDTDDAMGFNIYDIAVPKDYKYLVVKLENTLSCISSDLDKMLKVIINNDVIFSQIESNCHYNDKQFTYKEDGLFLFKLPLATLYDGNIKKLTVTFWKIKLRGLLVQFYFS